MLKWLLGQDKTEFPTKQGVDAASCVSLLDLHGSLFCLDNQNILFYEDGKPRVLAPVSITPADESKLKDFDAIDLDNDSFAIRYKGNDYAYRAKFEVTKLRDNIYIKIKDVKQQSFGTYEQGNCIIIDRDGNGPR